MIFGEMMVRKMGTVPGECEPVCGKSRMGDGEMPLDGKLLD